MTADRTQFNPAIAALAMPDKNSSIAYAIGDGLSEYAKQQKLNTMFDTELAGKKLDQETKQFSLDTAKQKAPIDLQTAQVSLDNAIYDKDVIKPLQTQSVQLTVDQKQTEKDNGVWDAQNQTIKAQAAVANANASVADEKAKLSVDTQKAELANAGLTQQINQLKLSAAKSDDAIIQASYHFYDDKNGDGVVNEKDFVLIKQGLKEKGVPEEFADAAYMRARGDVAKVEETESKSTKNIALTMKQENVGKVKDKIADQFSGMEQLKNLMVEGYSPEKAGAYGGTKQAIQEAIPVLGSQDSSYYASQREAIKGALAKAVGGSAPSNYEQQMAEKIVGGVWNSQEGAAAKYKSALDRGIIGMQETINRLDASNIDTSAYKTRLNDYTTFRKEINSWDGTQSLGDFLKTQKSTPEQPQERQVKFSASKTPSSTPQTPPKKEGVPDPFAY